MEYLFHYTKETHIDDILNKQTLLINNIDQTNDPYENKIFDTYNDNETHRIIIADHDNLIIDQIGSIDISDDSDELYKSYTDSGFDYSYDLDDVSFYEKRIYSETLENTINERIIEKMNGIDDNNQQHYFQHYTNMKNRITKTISFSIGEYNKKAINENNRPGYLYPRMWAQYGNNSRGICLVFKKDKLINDMRKQLSSDFHIFANHIKYIDILSENRKREISDLIKHRNKIFKHPNKHKRDMLVNNMIKHIDKYFFTKDNDWKGEREFRILIINKTHNNDIKPKIIRLDMSKVLHCVVLGENFLYRNDDEEQIDTEKELDTIKYICRNKKIGLNIIKRDIYRSKYILEKIS